VKLSASIFQDGFIRPHCFLCTLCVAIAVTDGNTCSSLRSNSSLHKQSQSTFHSTSVFASHSKRYAHNDQLHSVPGRDRLAHPAFLQVQSVRNVKLATHLHLVPGPASRCGAQLYLSFVRSPRISVRKSGIYRTLIALQRTTLDVCGP
jgi:hypothetical protein